MGGLCILLLGLWCQRSIYRIDVILRHVVPPTQWLHNWLNRMPHYTVIVQVEEMEKERAERLKQWENFLDDDMGEGGGESGISREEGKTGEREKGRKVRELQSVREKPKMKQ